MFLGECRTRLGGLADELDLLIVIIEAPDYFRPHPKQFFDPDIKGCFDETRKAVLAAISGR